MGNVPRHRTRNASWAVTGSVDEANHLTVDGPEMVNRAILMDIRDELRDLNRLLNCHNVIGGFRALQTINKRMGKFDALKLRKPK